MGNGNGKGTGIKKLHVQLQVNNKLKGLEELHLGDKYV